ncbi:uncharacterized protein METZ01_LOCUS357589 [marine metagenome]|uniref:Uncharacterized protein n=1 Tax=marine metagenome TaxID=408172 RepID=A0A382S5G5_9ZZZZ
MVKVAVAVSIVFVGMAGPVATAQDAVVRVTGEVVSLDCYPRLGESGRGKNHAECALHCAKGGSELGVLTDEGLYTVIVKPAEADELRELVASQVTVEGVRFDQDGARFLDFQSIVRP